MRNDMKPEAELAKVHCTIPGLFNMLNEIPVNSFVNSAQPHLCSLPQPFLIATNTNSRTWIKNKLKTSG